MNSDSVYIIGKSHQNCQDYTGQGEGFVLLSDGCSSSPHTDIGARLLVHSAVKLLKENRAVTKQFPLQVVEEAAKLNRQLALPPEALDATFLAAIADGNELKLFAAGDGHLVIGWDSGEVSHLKLDYPAGFPYYLNYTLDECRLQAFRQKNQKREEECRTFLPEEEEYRECTPEKRLSLEGESGYLALELPKVRFVALFSDGIDSFYSLKQTESGKQTIRESSYDLLPELLAIKQPAGEFVKRRVKRFMTNMEKRGIYHFDDFSYAALMLD